MFNGLEIEFAQLGPQLQTRDLLPFFPFTDPRRDAPRYVSGDGVPDREETPLSGDPGHPHAPPVGQLLTRGLHLIEEKGQEAEGCALLGEALARKPACGASVANACIGRATKLLELLKSEQSGDSANVPQIAHTVFGLLNVAEQGLRALEELEIELAFREPSLGERDLDVLSVARPLVEHYMLLADLLSAKGLQMGLVAKAMGIVEQLIRDFPRCRSEELHSTFEDVAVRVAVAGSLLEPTILDEAKLEAMDNQVASKHSLPY